jgi:nucleotide-binding universal stress UspA family protein
MDMKTILVPMENSEAIQPALETALLLGRRNDAYIEGFALRWPIVLAGLDMVGGLAPDSLEQDNLEEEKKARQFFEGFMQKHDVPRSTETTESLSFGWLDDAPRRGISLVAMAAFFDVIVMNRRNGESGALHDGATSR